MDTERRESPAARLVRVLAAAAPLLLLACLSLALGSGRVIAEHNAEGAVGGLAMGLLCGLGPIAIWAMFHWPPLLALAASILLWTTWLFLVAFTRVGRGHWSRYFLAGLLWCVVGLLTVMFEAIQN